MSSKSHAALVDSSSDNLPREYSHSMHYEIIHGSPDVAVKCKETAGVGLHTELSTVQLLSDSNREMLSLTGQIVTHANSLVDIYSDPFTKASSLSQDHSFFESDASAEFMSSSLDYNSDVVGVTPNSYSPSLEYSSDLVGVTPISYCPSLDYNSDLVGVTPNSYSSSQDYRSDLVGLTPSSYSPSLDYSSDLVGCDPSAGADVRWPVRGHVTPTNYIKSDVLTYKSGWFSGELYAHHKRSVKGPPLSERTKHHFILTIRFCLWDVSYVNPCSSQLRSTGKKIGGSRRFATTVADGTKETYNK
ncbi:hypothetical protein YC2023_106135 [Brassica napus]